MDEQIGGAEKRGLRRWCLNHRGLRKQQLSQISQSCQLSVAGLRAAASSTGTSRKYFSADTRYFQFCQGHDWNPLPGDDFLLYVLFCCRVVQNFSAPICPCLHVGHPQTVEVGFTYPSGPMTLLARFLSGINRSSSTQRHRLLITTQLLREISRHVAFPRMWHPHDKAMLRAN